MTSNYRPHQRVSAKAPILQVSTIKFTYLHLPPKSGDTLYESQLSWAFLGVDLLFRFCRSCSSEERWHGSHLRPRDRKAFGEASEELHVVFLFFLLGDRLNGDHQTRGNCLVSAEKRHREIVSTHPLNTKGQPRGN